MTKKQAKKSDKRKPEEASFEETLAELEQIVVDLESGELGLSAALQRYEEGVGHLKSCHSLLEQAERKIELLSGVDASGQPITEPFDEDREEPLAEKAAARGKRWSREASSRRASGGSDDGEVDATASLF